jgi:hypothetical protein
VTVETSGDLAEWLDQRASRDGTDGSSYQSMSIQSGFMVNGILHGNSGVNVVNVSGEITVT